MKIIACGSRAWEDVGSVWERLFLLPEGSFVVHGHSPGGGADKIIDTCARGMGHRVIRVTISAEDSERAGARQRRAPIFRNLRMYDEHPDAELVLEIIREAVE